MQSKLMPSFGLFIVALSIAYFASRDEVEYKKDQERWLDIDLSEIQELSFESPERKMLITRKPNGIFWAHSIVYEPSKKNADTMKKQDQPAEVHSHDGHDHGMHVQEGVKSADEGPDKVVEDSSQQKISKDIEFRLKPTVAEFISSWGNLEIFKNLGEASDLDLSQYGLKDSKSFAAIKTKKKTYRFSIGSQGFQSPYVFLLDQEKNIVVLAKRQLTKKFEEISYHYYARVLETYDDKANRAVVSVDNKQVEFFKTKKLKPKQGASPSEKNYEWIWSMANDQKNEVGATWIQKLMKIYVQLYQKTGDQKDYSKDDAQMVFELFKDDQLLVRYSFMEVPIDGENEVWVSGQSLPAPARVPHSKFKTLVEDFATLL